MKIIDFTVDTTLGWCAGFLLSPTDQEVHILSANVLQTCIDVGGLV